jgi:hypothetical protein
MRPPAHGLLAGAWLACAALAFAAAPARAEWSRVAHFCTGQNPQLGCATAFTGGPGDNIMTVETVHVGGSSADADNTSGVVAPEADTSGPTLPVMPATPLTATRGRFAFRIGVFDEPVAGSVRMVSAPIGAAQKRIKLPLQRFAAVAGEEVALEFQLDRGQRKLLAKARKVKMFAAVVANDALGNVSYRTVPFRLKAKRTRN